MSMSNFLYPDPSLFESLTANKSYHNFLQRNRRRSLENEDIDACRNRAMSFDNKNFLTARGSNISPNSKRRCTFAASTTTQSSNRAQVPGLYSHID